MQYAMPCQTMLMTMQFRAYHTNYANHANDVMQCHAMPCHTMPCHVIPCHTMPLLACQVLRCPLQPLLAGCGSWGPPWTTTSEVRAQHTRC